MLTRAAGFLATGGFSALDFQARKTVVAAVSGGGDSLAMLLLLQAHLARHASSAAIHAVTVDHRLRPESAAEAKEVAAFCDRRGISHSVLCWDGQKPASGLSAAAREARYRLLAQAAREAGSDLVLTGHTLDDQAETVLMRKERGEGLGLAGIAPATLFQGEVWFGRPLLGESREALRDFLRKEGVSWIDDPSNDNPHFERVRARRQIAASADPEALRRALLAEAAGAAARRVELGAAAAALIRSGVDQVSPGLFRIDPTALSAAPEPAAIHALRLLLAACGGRGRLPDEDRTSALLHRALAEKLRATLSGVVVDVRRQGIFLHREWRGGGPAVMPAAHGAVWDGRFRVLAKDESRRRPELAVAPMGHLAAAKYPAPEGVTAADLARAALAAQPVIRPMGDAEAQADLLPVVPPYDRFLPSFDLAPAQALAALFGAPAFPPPPFAGRNQPGVRTC